MELDYDAMKFWFDVFLSICLVASALRDPSTLEWHSDPH
jgi:hypothetical protein